MSTRDDVLTRIEAFSHPVLRIVLPVTILAILAWPAVDAVLRGLGLGVAFGRFDDFGTYYLAAQRAAGCLHSTSIHCPAIYQEHLSSTAANHLPVGLVLPYVYPPLFAYVFMVFLTVPYTTGAVIWGLLGIGLLWVGLIMLADSLNTRLSWPARLSLLVLLVSWQPILYGFKQGEVTSLLAGIFTLGLALLERARRQPDGRRLSFLAGVLYAIPIFIKPIYAPAAAPLLRDRWRLAGVATTGTSLTVLSILTGGMQATTAYAGTLAFGKGWGLTMRPLWNWTAGYFEPFGPFGHIGIGIRIVLLAVVVWLAILKLGDVRVDRLVAALGLLVIPVAAPVAYTLEFILLLPAVVLLARDVVSQRRMGLSLLVLALLGMHVQGYSALLAKYAPAWFQTIYWLIQPGVWAVWLVILYTITKLLDEREVSVRAGVRVRSRDES